ncbi:MAG: hypothetical protein OWT28_10775 [Firmicutes bacterium]|nr:hypothetical protein [Bacillota bacterium]
MASWVNVGQIYTSAMTNAAGQFFGQNVQNGWDSHAPTLIGAGFNMGDFAWMHTSRVAVVTKAQTLMPVFDPDQKYLYSPTVIR